MRTKNVPHKLRRKPDDKGEKMILAGYHSTDGYKTYGVVKKKVVISKDVIFDEIKEWKKVVVEYHKPGTI